MQQLTPAVPHDNSLKYNSFIYSENSGEKEKSPISPHTSYHTNVSDPDNPFFNLCLGWEDFSNELEFE